MFACLAALALAAAPASTPSAQLTALLDDAAAWRFTAEPLSATFAGIPGYDDQLPHVTPADLAAQAKEGDALLSRLRALDRAKLSPPERDLADTMAFVVSQDVAVARSGLEQLPWTQLDGSHLLANLAPLQPVGTPAALEAYARRLSQLPRLFDEEMANARRGLAHGFVPQKFCAEKVRAQVEAFTSAQALKAAYLGPVKEVPKGFDASTHAALVKKLEGLVEQKLVPAYAKLLAFVRDEWVPKARTTDGVWALPHGEALYATLIRGATTLEARPEDLHATGLAEVARLEAELGVVAKKAGHADLASFQKALAADPSNHPKSGDALLAAYTKAIDAYRPFLAKQFGRLPKADLVVVPTEAYRAESAPSAEYQSGKPDGSAPGRVVVNTFQAEQRVLWDAEDTAYHEGLPGHHLQLMIASEDQGSSVFMRAVLLNAFDEGWALYAERLPKEVGLYATPVAEFGRLDGERLRAVRLVVDTGMHWKKWTREEALAYLRAHTALAEVDARAEIDRYAVWPGQALGYKVGQLTLVELRQKAEKALGKRFDLRAFHDAVLVGGSKPLPVLKARIERYIQEQGK